MDRREAKTRKPLLGLIMLREGLLDEGMLMAAVERWTAHREAGEIVAFGHVVVAMGFCQPHELAPFLALQRKLATVPGGRKPLGHLLIENALLTPTQVTLALRLQRATGQKLGELLVAEELLREPQLEVLLRFQGREEVVAAA